VLVLSHSLGADSTMWRPQLDALRARWRLLLYDHPGHGQSAGPPQGLAIADYGRDLLALLDHLALDRIDFCGLSLGGMVGQWLGAEAPDRVRRLVLASTTARIENPELLRGRIEGIRREGLEPIIPGVIEKWFTPAGLERDPALAEQARTMLSHCEPEAYARTATTVCELDLREPARRIEAPTTILYGESDQATPPAWNEALAKLIPGATAVPLPGAHLLNLESPSEFTDALQRALAR